MDWKELYKNIGKKSFQVNTILFLTIVILSKSIMGKHFDTLLNSMIKSYNIQYFIDKYSIAEITIGLLELLAIFSSVSVVLFLVVLGIQWFFSNVIKMKIGESSFEFTVEILINNFALTSLNLYIILNQILIIVNGISSFNNFSPWSLLPKVLFIPFIFIVIADLYLILSVFIHEERKL